MTAGMGVIAYFDQHIQLINWLGPRFGYRVINAVSDLNFGGPHATLDRKLRAILNTWVIILPFENASLNRRASSAQWGQFSHMTNGGGPPIHTTPTPVQRPSVAPMSPIVNVQNPTPGPPMNTMNTMNTGSTSPISPVLPPATPVSLNASISPAAPPQNTVVLPPAFTPPLSPASSIASPASNSSAQTPTSITPSSSYPFPTGRQPSVVRRKAPPRPRKFILARALDTFIPEDGNDDELPFNEGDTIEILEKSAALEEDGWCRARVKGGIKIGLAPLEYLEELGKAETTSIPSIPEDPTNTPAQHNSNPTTMQNPPSQPIPQDSGAPLPSSAPFPIRIPQSDPPTQLNNQNAFNSPPAYNGAPFNSGPGYNNNPVYDNGSQSNNAPVYNTPMSNGPIVNQSINASPALDPNVMLYASMMQGSNSGAAPAAPPIIIDQTDPALSDSTASAMTPVTVDDTAGKEVDTYTILTSSPVLDPSAATVLPQSIDPMAIPIPTSNPLEPTVLPQAIDPLANPISPLAGLSNPEASVAAVDPFYAAMNPGLVSSPFGDPLMQSTGSPLGVLDPSMNATTDTSLGDGTTTGLENPLAGLGLGSPGGNVTMGDGCGSGNVVVEQSTVVEQDTTFFDQSSGGVVEVDTTFVDDECYDDF